MIKETQIKVKVTLDGAEFLLQATVPKHSTSRQAKAAHVRDLADQIAHFIESPRKSPRTPKCLRCGNHLTAPRADGSPMCADCGHPIFRS